MSTNVQILLGVVCAFFGAGFIYSQYMLNKVLGREKIALGLIKTTTEARDKLKTELKELKDNGVSLPPKCEYCGEMKIQPNRYKELVVATAEAHAFECPETLAAVPHYGAIIRKEKEEREELQRTPVEVVLERHKVAAEEARNQKAIAMTKLEKV